VAWRGNEPTAICYAAAVAQGQVEIDVLTAAAYRRSGLGKQVVRAFSKNCTAHGLQPVWDCFTNNAGSMALCRASGFKANQRPYAFYTFNK
jgi:RimJ/RimL family protein N-acetyltransferase